MKRVYIYSFTEIHETCVYIYSFTETHETCVYILILRYVFFHDIF